MNRKQFFILLALVVVIGAAGLMVHLRSNHSWQSDANTIGQKLLPGLAVNDVAQITIKAGTNELNLAKRDNLWRVRERGDYPANFAQISELLLKFADLKVAQSEDIGPSQLGRFELLPPGADKNSGTLVEFKDQSGKTLNSVLLGKKHLRKPTGDSQFPGMGDEGWPDGRYVLAGADSKQLVVISDALDGAQPKPEQWLNKDFLSIEKPRSIELKFPEATNSWKLIRASETNNWQLADAKGDEKLDASKVPNVTNPFSSASFNDANPLNNGSTTNCTLLKVGTMDGFTYLAKIGMKLNDYYPVSFAISAQIAAERIPAKDEKAEDKLKFDKDFKDLQSRLKEKLARESILTNWIYQVPAYSIDSLLTPRAELLVDLKKDEKPSGSNK